MIKQFIIRVCFLIVAISLQANEYIDKNPSMLVKSDIEFLGKFEDKIYDLSLHVKNYNVLIMEVRSFVRAHSIYNEVADTHWRIDFKAKAGIIGGQTVDETANHREIIGLEFTYPLLDSKEKKEYIEKRIIREASAIDNIKEYFGVIKDLSNLEIEENYYRMIELRQKAREKQGIIHLDNRLETIKKLIDIRAKVEGLQIKKFEFKEKILISVHSSYQAELEKLLTL